MSDGFGEVGAENVPINCDTCGELAIRTEKSTDGKSHDFCASCWTSFQMYLNGVYDGRKFG